MKPEDFEIEEKPRIIEIWICEKCGKVCINQTYETKRKTEIKPVCVYCKSIFVRLIKIIPLEDVIQMMEELKDKVDKKFDRLSNNNKGFKKLIDETFKPLKEGE